MIVNAFTCTGPYAVLIMLGIKRAENRSVKPEPVKGRAAVSCSKSFCKEEYGNFVQWAAQALPEEDFERLPAWSDVKDWAGKVVGCVDYSCRESDAQEAWNEGYRFWWDLSEVVCFDAPIPCRGNVGMWQMPPELAKRVSAADELARLSDGRVRTAEDAARIFHAALPIVGGNEGFFVLPLDDDGKPKSAPVLVSLGEVATAAVQLKDVFAEVLKSDAASFVVAHNHPSGNLVPSADDVAITNALKEESARLGVKMLDHLIIGSDGTFRSVSV